ncbi:MAG TPA: inorganic phosphate transporter [Verrucomicrobiota bacterium]|nr:inorganic phosphate transporter [Verrucomicrobiota bacterium]HNU50579.1 inorganic phosphate transporter [Verrucomicrobiota bacterium]
MTLVFLIILAALTFEFINGFHDTANAIATTVATKVLTPRQAVIMSAVFNLLGALVGTAVATTIGRELVDIQQVNSTVILCALLSGIFWNLLTWWFGLPSSSSHALIGGLCGATLAAAGGRWSVLHWSVANAATGKLEGLWPKVVKPMVLSPVCGALIGFLVMALLLLCVRHWRPARVKSWFTNIHLLSAAWMSFSHGTNDAQKTMGIIALTLFTATQTPGVFNNLPDWLSFLRSPVFHVPPWIKVVCALTMAAGTATGGWRIISTLGRKMVKLQPIHGVAAQTTAAAIIQIASHWGMPLSTTHVISSSIMGVGATRRLNAVRWTVVERMVWAWIMTLPLTGALGYGLAWLVIHGLR